mmetsp:Transcript_17041/g.40844  ORF Transcript_17041/g.40844 Transcript_17041/m.40844 type:complete len:204 (-) Transcript_17041:1760-2371(-)
MFITSDLVSDRPLDHLLRHSHSWVVCDFDPNCHYLEEDHSCLQVDHPQDLLWGEVLLVSCKYHHRLSPPNVPVADIFHEKAQAAQEVRAPLDEIDQAEDVAAAVHAVGETVVALDSPLLLSRHAAAAVDSLLALLLYHHDYEKVAAVAVVAAGLDRRCRRHRSPVDESHLSPAQGNPAVAAVADTDLASTGHHRHIDFRHRCC